MKKYIILILLLFCCGIPEKAMPKTSSMPPLLYITDAKLVLNNKALPELQITVLNLYNRENVIAQNFVIEIFMYHDRDGFKKESKNDGIGDNFAYLEFNSNLKYGESKTFKKILYGHYDANVVLYKFFMVDYSDGLYVLCNSRGAECYSSLVCLKSVKYCEL
jgi:hypothetical protein